MVTYSLLMNRCRFESCLNHNQNSRQLENKVGTNTYNIMSKLLSVSIDVTKINKSELIVGAKGTYLNLTVSLNDEEDKFGNTVSAWQSQSKEQREAKTDRNFLGNGKVLYSSEVATKTVTPEATVPDSLPF